MSAAERQDRALDALAILAAHLHDDADGFDALLNASDDVEHWRGVASVLAGWLSGSLRQHDYEGFLTWQRERILTGRVGQDPDELGGER